MTKTLREEAEDWARYEGSADAAKWPMLEAAFMAGARAQRERDSTIALEQRCERGTPWDAACVETAQKIGTQSS